MASRRARCRTARVKFGPTSPSCTAPTTRRACSSRSCVRRRSRTRCRAARASSTAPRSRTCAPGCACSSTRTTTRPSCAPSPRPSAASATPTLGALGEFAGKWKRQPVRGAVRRQPAHGAGAQARSARCTSSAATSTTSSIERATPRAPTTRKALLLGWLKDIGYEQHLYDNEDSEKLAAARWSNVLDFVDWIAKRCGGQVTHGGRRVREREAERAAGGADASA